MATAKGCVKFSNTQIEEGMNATVTRLAVGLESLDGQEHDLQFVQADTELLSLLCQRDDFVWRRSLLYFGQGGIDPLH